MSLSQGSQPLNGGQMKSSKPPPPQLLFERIWTKFMAPGGLWAGAWPNPHLPPNLGWYIFETSVFLGEVTGETAPFLCTLL